MSTGQGVTGANPTANTTSVLRIMNERAVYERIRVLGPVSRPQLAAATGLSKPTISLALADLERAGLVLSVGHRTGNAGRAALLYEISPGAGWVIGLDVGREWIRAALVDLAGEIAVRRDVPAGADGPAELIERLGGIVDDLSGKAGGAITTVVLGTPGILDEEHDRLRLAPNLPGWERPGVIGRVGTILGDAGVNIADMDVGRRPTTDGALMVIATSQPAPDEVVAALRSCDGIIEVAVIAGT